MSTVISSIDHIANSINPMKQPMQDLTDATVTKVYKPAGQLYDYSNSHAVESAAVMGAAYGGASMLAGDGAEAGVGAGADAAAETAAGGAADAGAGAAADAGASGAAAGSLPADVSVGTTGAGGATATAGGASAAGSGLTTAQEIQLGLSAASLAKSALTPAPSLPTPATPTQMPNGPESQGGSAAQAAMSGTGQAGGAPGVAQTLLTGAGGVDPSTIGLGKNTLLGS